MRFLAAHFKCSKCSEEHMVGMLAEEQQSEQSSISICFSTTQKALGPRAVIPIAHFPIVKNNTDVALALVWTVWQFHERTSAEENVCHAPWMEAIECHRINTLCRHYLITQGPRRWKEWQSIWSCSKSMKPEAGGTSNTVSLTILAVSISHIFCQIFSS